MSGRVIQGYFVGGGIQARLVPGRTPGGPRMSGGNEAFSINPAQLGLAVGGGTPLPDALRDRMEAAFSADFSSVRVHEGPQPSRIGAVAFTMGNDIYFSPGSYQPDSAQGRRLLGHELAHVVQQRRGRVHAGGAGLEVVHDRVLEAEADRWGDVVAANAPAPLPSHQPILRAGAAQSGAAWNVGVVQLKRSGGRILKNNNVSEYLTSDFVSLHVANDDAEAQTIAQHRDVEACHVIARSSLTDLINEVKDRRASGYYANAANQVLNAATGNMQFLSGVSVTIYETRRNNRGRLKKTTTLKTRFYYDAPLFNGKYVIHHFDGVA